MRCDDDDADDSAERRRHFNPKQANILICDEDPTASLVEQGRLSAEDIRGSARMGSGMILAGLVRPGGLLTYLRDQGVSADQLREVADGARTNAQS
jgi:hypothetical protein